MEMTPIRWLTLVVSAVLLAASLVLLFPTPFESQQQVAEYYKQQQSELSSHLDEMKVSAAELEKSISFSIARQQRDIWLRWSASLLFFALTAMSFWRYVKTQSAVSKTGLFVAAVTYLAVWFFAVIVLGDPSRATILDSFVGRILNELAIGNPVVFARFLLIYALAPLASLALVFLLMSESRQQSV